MMYNGILNIYKEQGYTSFDVVAKLRGILKQKKIGHTGTLDPMAEGVLLVCLGQATKLSEMITSKTKEYEAELKLGLVTDTEDITGKVLSEAKVAVTEEQVEEGILSFLGTFGQIPPMYSAIKKDGKKLYEYARAGISIDREPREVTIYDMKILEMKLPYVRFYIRCSKGTYIRSLCRDIGEKLGCGAVMSGLIRREVNGYLDQDGLRLSQVEELVRNGNIQEHIYPMDTLLKQYKRASILPEEAKYLLNGNKLQPEQLTFFEDSATQGVIPPDKEETQNLYRIYLGQEMKALYTYDETENIFRPYKMFLEK
jgi:tRNA pseudouridine55 synthase